MTYQVSRAIDYRLQWVKNNQDVFNLHPEAATESTNDADQDMEGGRHESESFLSQSFHGSRRHLRSLAINALTIVTELVKPTFFITFLVMYIGLNSMSNYFQDKLLMVYKNNHVTICI